MREIFEQPEALRRMLEAYTEGAGLREELFALAAEAMARCGNLVIAASGSSRLGGLAGKVLLEDLAGLRVAEVEGEAYVADARSLPALLEGALPGWEAQVAKMLGSLGEVSNLPAGGAAVAGLLCGYAGGD